MPPKKGGSNPGPDKTPAPKDPKPDSKKEDEKPTPPASKIPVPKGPIPARLTLGGSSTPSKIPTPTSPATRFPSIHTTPATPTSGPKESQGSKQVSGSKLAVSGTVKKEEKKTLGGGEGDVVPKLLNISNPATKAEDEDKDVAGTGEESSQEGSSKLESPPSLAPAPLFSRPAHLDASDNGSDSGSSNVPGIDSSTDVSVVDESASSVPPSTGPSPARPPRGPAPTSAPRPDVEAPTSVSTSESESSRATNPWFNQAETTDGAPPSETPLDVADRAQTMTKDNETLPANDPTTLRPYRSTRIEQEQAHLAAEAASLNPSLGEETKLSPFISPEISAFQDYAAQNADKECVKLGTAALKAAMYKEREDMIEVLQLVNANRALNEGMKMRDAHLKTVLEDAVKVKEKEAFNQDWWEKLDKAVKVSKSEKEALQRDLDEIRVKNQALQKENDELKGQAKNDGESVDYWKKRISDKDAEIEKLKAENGDLVSQADSAALNAAENEKLSKKVIELEAELAAATAPPQPTTSDAGNDNLLTEEQFNERLAAEKKPLQDTIDALEREVSGAAEALRAIQQADSDKANQQLLKDTRPLRQQIAEVGAEVQRCKAEVLRQKQELAAHGTVTTDKENCNDVKAENERLKQEASSKDESLLNLTAASLQLDEDLKTLQAKLATKIPAASGADAKTLASLKDSNKTLREGNENLREKVQTLQRNLAAVKEQRDELKDALRDLDPMPSQSMSPAIKPENPEITRLQERIDELEAKEEQYKKELQELKVRSERDMEAANAVNERLELGNNELKESIADRNATILSNLKHCEEKKKELQAKIQALDAAKADREAQLQRQKIRIAELEGRGSGKEMGALAPNTCSILTSRFADAGNPSSGTTQATIENRDRDDVQPSVGTMEVVILRCEIALGQLQATRKQTGYTEGDALLAISVAQEAQGMAERLQDSAWIGRATFWRGIAEWMAGNSTAAEGFFETSASHEWSEPENERSRLQEWWDTAKTAHVDKTSRAGPENLTPSKKHSSSRRDRSKNKDKSDGRRKRGGKKSDEDKSKDGKTKKHRKHKETETQSPPAAVYEQVQTRVEVRPARLTDYATLRALRIAGQLPGPVEQNRIDTDYVEELRGTWVQNPAAGPAPLAPASEATAQPTNGWFGTCSTQ